MMDSELDKLLKAEADNMPEISTRLMENMIADAAVMSPPIMADRPLVIDTPRDSWLKRLLEPFGGTPALAAVICCGVFGAGFGYAGTDMLQSVPGMDGVITSFEDDPIDDLSIGSLSNFDSILAEG